MNRFSIVRFAGPAVAAAWLAVAGSSPVVAQDPIPPFDRVEEDWELVIDQADLIAEGPQITTTMSPLGDNAGLFVAFNLNYRDQPSYLPGGLEVIAYDGDRVLTASSQGTGRLATSGEAISWTQSLRLSGGLLEYEVVGGASSTWGAFGRGSGATLGVQAACPLAGLEGYRPTASVSFSGPGWQSNLVRSMRLVRVRYYAGDELVAIDEEARPVNLGL